MPSNTPSPTTRKQILLRRYEIGKVLGQGSFGKVYVATNLVTNQLVAIKVIDKEKILKTGLIAHIKREISILRRVRHPNIVQLYEVMATKTKIYFVMEYVTGGELFTKVAKGRLKEEIARKYFQQLISAVGFCHARGVYHRDLKPENILLDENGDLKVSDFGLSAISEQICADGLFYTFCGTPAYVSPEVLGRKGYEASKVDIWACGVILFVLMAGYLPFRDQNVMVMYRKIFKGEFRKPRWFSGELSRLLKRLLDTSPETRISVPEIMEDKWFKKGFKQVKFYFEDDKICSVKNGENEDDDGCIEYCSDQSCCDSESELVDGKRRSNSSSNSSVSNLPRPMSLNAFDLILFSPRFSLSGLFEDVSEESRFLTSDSVSRIVSTVEEIAKGVGFSIRRKDCRISLEGSKEGVKGPLMVTVEIFELTPILRVVEVKKNSGDRNEYEEFCESQLKPGLQPLLLPGSDGEPSQLLSNTPNGEIKGIE